MSGFSARLALATISLLVCFGARAHAEQPAPSPRGPAQLELLVAPLALHPDPLLAQILMASTYPLEVVEAARWSQANPGVTGQALEEAMQNESWDPSVKGLTAVPQILQMMNDKPDWTQELGDAFLAQQPAVLDAIQRLRARANAAGYLKTTPQQKLARVAAPPPAGSSAPPATLYLIEPPTADEYSVPVYDPSLVYGTWPHPEQPPFSWYPPGHPAGNVLSFAAAVLVGGAIWGRVDWWQHRVNVNVSRFNQFNHTKITRITWVHSPAHRGNVPYHDRNVAAQFSEAAKAAREADRGKTDLDRRDSGEEAKADRPEAESRRKRSEDSAHGARSKHPRRAASRESGTRHRSRARAGRRR